MMTKLVILSPLVGTPGDEFIPKPGVNVQALLDANFICLVGNEVDVTTLGTVSTKKQGKTRKVKPAPEE